MEVTRIIPAKSLSLLPPKFNNLGIIPESGRVDAFPAWSLCRKPGTNRLKVNHCLKPAGARVVSSPNSTLETALTGIPAALTAPMVQSEPSLTVSPSSLQCEPGFLLRNRWLNVENGGGGNGALNSATYLRKILTSKVYDVAIESKLELATKLSKKIGVNIWLKREDLQPVFSFKLRGAYNMMAKLPKEQLEKGVICSSAGNHAQGVALAAKKLGCNAVIAMPVTTPEIKWKSVERLGGNVVLIGDSYDEAQSYAKMRALEEGLTFIHPFDHPDVISGQGTVGMEIVRQMKDIESLYAVFVPVGGGGLIAGIAAYLKSVSPDIKIIGVEPSDANAMAHSLHRGQRVVLDQVGGFADGVAVKMVGEETFRLCKDLIDGIVLVSRDAICASIKDMFEEKRNILEPAGALALAGAKAYSEYYGLQGENVIAITSGANMNFDRLRLVTELANVGRQKEAVLATFMPEEPGSFKKFCQLVGDMNITEFKYRCNKADKEKAQVVYSIGLHTKSELEAMISRMRSSNFGTLDLTDNDLVKDHLRYLSGRLSHIRDEILCRFVFPERPGSLMKFLDVFSPRWNITLFHYRTQGETGANVLVGIQVAESEMDEFRDRANALGYEYEVEDSNKTFKLLMY
ncbi:OLC1v1020206C1 [Oldenlandia corymbosa var. corymbosa]|uniref:Threonine dehydratase n=1 Tax=Oldenlandia corymbosa var. corymbosa TaxID=529605 RepID=A0AAV1EG10_OLDCO|nr:OLC1v1020206C1 [Oldenlandia corymbosa var. corymbosa]